MMPTPCAAHLPKKTMRTFTAATATRRVDEFTDKMCALEGAEAGLSTASGMSAVFASMFALLKAGDHLLCCSSVFGSTFTIVTKYLSRYGIEHTLVPANDKEAWQKRGEGKH